MALVIRSIVAVRLALSGLRTVLLISAWLLPLLAANRLLASAICASSWASCASTSFFAAAGTLGSLSDTDGQLTVCFCWLFGHPGRCCWPSPQWLRTLRPFCCVVVTS